jgi:hypothetical protein
MFTPWGALIETVRLEPGLTGVRTEQHGGLMLALGYAERRLSTLKVLTNTNPFLKAEVVRAGGPVS